MTPEQIAVFEKDPAYGEIFRDDEYRLRHISNPPKLVFDIGANIGIFTAAVKERWPEAKVVAVEPHPDNFKVLVDMIGNMPGVEAVRAALAQTEPVFFRCGQNPGGHHFRGRAFSGCCAPTDVPAVMLDALAERFGHPNMVKIDTEGGEEALLGHKPSRDVLAAADVITMERHPGGRDNAYVAEMTQYISSFADTHDIPVSNARLVWMRKRNQT